VGDQIPIDLGGQTASLDARLGPPPPAEVAASLSAAADLGALGETFFDWNATTDAQWKAIGRTPFAPSTAEPSPLPPDEPSIAPPDEPSPSPTNEPRPSP
jgi:hypothetical protein